jgi:hypothetical protein
MSAILDLITGGIGPYIIAALGAMVAIVTAFFRGKASANAKRDARDAKANEQAHGRMNDADLGIGATDGERIDRLRGFAAKHGNRPAKGSGG